LENDLTKILIEKDELVLKHAYELPPEKLFAYDGTEDPEAWQARCRKKLLELVACVFAQESKNACVFAQESKNACVFAQESKNTSVLNFESRSFKTLRETEFDFGTAHSLVMHADKNLTLPGYLLVPNEIKQNAPVLAVQGHTHDVKGILGIRGDYHHGFGMELCRAGFVTLVPETRGFGTLKNLAEHDGRRLTYWSDPVTFSIVTDAFQKGRTLIGDTVADLYAWAGYLCGFTKQKNYSLAGISYGGDMCLMLAALDEHVCKTFASGTLGSMATIFDVCCNAPAHCVPNILQYMDRQEIASCIAPRPLAVHYGELDVPSKKNYSASFNETALPAFEAVKNFYAKMGAEKNAKLIVSPGMGHEMDINELVSFLGEDIDN